jgi:hypothetical protein
MANAIESELLAPTAPECVSSEVIDDPTRNKPDPYISRIGEAGCSKNLPEANGKKIR